MFLFSEKANCFDKIKTKYGSKCTYIVIGDGAEDKDAADECGGLPFWRINHKGDLENLLMALQLYL